MCLNCDNELDLEEIILESILYILYVTLILTWKTLFSNQYLTCNIDPDLEDVISESMYLTCDIELDLESVLTAAVCGDTGVQTRVPLLSGMNNERVNAIFIYHNFMVLIIMNLKTCQFLSNLHLFIYIRMIYYAN